jgi:hypothetical protein
LHSTKITRILDRVGYSYDITNLRGDDLWCLCPFHADREIGSFSINVETGEYHCFSCKAGGGGIVKFVMDYNGMNFKEAKQLVGSDDLDYSNYTSNLKNISREKERKLEKKLSMVKANPFQMPMDLELFDVKSNFYCRTHNIPKVFVNRYQWMVATKGYYTNYFIIPVFHGGEIVTYEARKAYEYETLCEVYGEKVYGKLRHFKELKQRFKDDNYRLKDKIVHKDGEPVYFDNYLYWKYVYLIRPKVLYPKNSPVTTTIYNHDLLDRSKPLYLVESVSSVPNIWLYVSKNVTATFGAKLTEEQLKILQQFDSIVVYPDNDLAGKIFCEELMDGLGSRVSVIEVPTDGAEATPEQLRGEPVLISKWIFRKLREMNDVNS